jgi:putative transposase
MVHSKKPFGGPEAVLAYLARYTHRVAISNRRLIAADAMDITFKYKHYRIQGPERYKLMTLAPRQRLAIAAATPNLIPMPLPPTDQPVKVQCVPPLENRRLLNEPFSLIRLPLDPSGSASPAAKTRKRKRHGIPSLA